MFINKQLKLDIPVYTVWGACEDVRVLEKFRSGEYKVDNLHIIDEANSRLLEVGGVKLRLLGLGGAVVMHKLFDNGEGRTTIAGGQGTMWTTLLQMGELVDTANRVYDPTETRVFVTHASPAREGLLNQLSVTLKADFSVSAGLHFRYGSSYNEFSVNPTLDHYRGKLAASKASFNDVWETVKSEVEPAVSQNEAQRQLLDNALEIVNKMPTVANGGNPFGQAMSNPGAGGQVDESAFKNMWNFNLADAAFGFLVLEIEGGRIGTEMRAQGFNFAHRGTGGKQGVGQPVQSPAQGAPMSQGMGPTNNRAPVAPSSQSSQQISQAQQPGQQPRTQQPPNQPKAAPAPPQQSQAQNQTQQSRGPPNQSQRPGPQASAAAPTAQSHVKPVTPQPSAPSTNNAAAAAPSEKPNASAPNQGKPADKTNGAGWDNSVAQLPDEKTSGDKKPSPPAGDKKQSTGLFIHNCENEQAVRDIFPEEDKAKIIRIERHGKSNHVVHFATHEDAAAALQRQPADHKRKTPGPPQAGQNLKPNVKYYDERGPNPRFRDNNQNSQGAGTWQGSNRPASGSTPKAGYQSDRNASDSEGGRGRGGFQGRGRGRGGERGRGRGRGGRGGGSGEDGAAPAASNDSKPAPASTPAAASSGDKA